MDGFPLVVQYMSVATLTAFSWDWLLSLADDFQIARRCGNKLSVLAYFLSRTTILATCIMAAILSTAPIADCETLFRLEELSAIVGTTATSFLFLARVRAVSENSRAITAFFGFFWLGILGTSILLLFAAYASDGGDMEHCMVSKVKPWMIVFLWAKAAYDTSIFFIISWRITSQFTTERTLKRSVITALWGHDLPRVCRDLLYSGQLYYFVTIGMTLFSASVTLASVEPTFRGFFTVPALALESSMACRVFRVVFLGAVEDGCVTRASMVLTTFMSQT